MNLRLQYVIRNSIYKKEYANTRKPIIFALRLSNLPVLFHLENETEIFLPSSVIITCS